MLSEEVFKKKQIIIKLHGKLILFNIKNKYNESGTVNIIDVDKFYVTEQNFY